ncbi:hypothetical protein J5U23_00678 [Saccharolobus shibatae B12]|uniref:Uncharacterized protein n=1 Tax=Saccharolobus shibatae (strain ATCC 51178 / DSM 5389 / JCM 8931 / NBRC 15437 / B12) TaxID=523848 RepID=A0A8F5GSJ7_SACSH|nr:hypothetical protein J5U23_00678 [Saccharolobus shibatae B12]
MVIRLRIITLIILKIISKLPFLEFDVKKEKKLSLVPQNWKVKK